MGDLFIFINSCVFWTVGEFKDDQLQEHEHALNGGSSSGGTPLMSYGFYSNETGVTSTQVITSARNARRGTTTRGKRKGVIYLIKVL